MSILSKLNLIRLSPSTYNKAHRDPVARYRTIMIDGLERQRKLILGESDEGRPAFAIKDSGAVLYLRYGNRGLSIGTEGQNAIKFESKDEMLVGIGEIIKAVEAGELDKELSAAAAVQRKPKAEAEAEGGDNANPATVTTGRRKKAA